MSRPLPQFSVVSQAMQTLFLDLWRRRCGYVYKVSFVPDTTQNHQHIVITAFLNTITETVVLISCPDVGWRHG